MDLRNNLCEELSRHDDMMMDLAEMGITLENCEQWSQRVVFAVIFVLFIVQLVRVSNPSGHTGRSLSTHAGPVLTGRFFLSFHSSTSSSRLPPYSRGCTRISTTSAARAE